MKEPDRLPLIWRCIRFFSFFVKVRLKFRLRAWKQQIAPLYCNHRDFEGGLSNEQNEDNSDSISHVDQYEPVWVL